MKKETFTYDSRDGSTKLHAVRYLPEGEIKGIIQIVHGMAEHMGRYEHVAEFFTGRGYLVTGEDHLGHGLSVPEGGLYGYFCHRDPATVVVRDVHRLKKMTEEAYPGIPYVIWGHSMGSFILRNYLTRYGTGIKGAIIEGTGQNPTSAVNAGLCMVRLGELLHGEKGYYDILPKLAFGDKSKLPEEHRNDWICTDPEVVKKYEEDSLSGFPFTVNGFRTLFTLIKRQNDKKSLQKIPKNLPILVISGGNDEIGACGEGVRMVCEEYRSLGLKDVTVKLYDGVRHEIHNEPIRGEVFEDVLRWLEK